MKWATAGIVLLASMCRGAAGNGLRAPKQDTLDPVLWEQGDHFEGDIRAPYEQIEHVYGAELANLLLKKGLVDSPRVYNRPGEQAVYTGARWNTRDWEGRVLVPYMLDPNANFGSAHVATIKLAMQGIMDVVPSVMFVERVDEPVYLFIKSDEPGCWSYVGKVFPGAQPLNLQNPGCVYKGTVQHELMHALGLYHEQSRPDRDEYVTVDEENVIAGYYTNFNKHSFVENLDVAYDLGSVMHYGPTAFGKWKVDCAPAPAVCGRAAAIQFVLGGATDQCIDGTGRLSACDGASDQRFFLNNIGHSVEIRKASDPSQCLVPPTIAGRLSSGALRWASCAGEHWDRFQIHGASLDGAVKLKWEGHRYYCITKDPWGSSALVLAGCGTSTGQTFSLDFSTVYNEGCQTYALCTDVDGTFATITSDETFGQRSGISGPDALQLQLLYQCESGPRNKGELCTRDCPCYAGFECSADEACRGDLVCLGDSGTCGEPPARTPGPTLAPSEATPSTATVSPSAGPISSPPPSTAAPECGAGQFERVEAACAFAGLRLCSLADIDAGKIQVECDAWNEFAWTSEACGNEPGGHYWRVRLRDGHTKCSSTKRRAQVLCCAN